MYNSEYDYDLFANHDHTSKHNHGFKHRHKPNPIDDPEHSDCKCDDCDDDSDYEHSIRCDGYPLSKYEQLLAEAIRQADIIKEYYNKLTNGITPKIFKMINHLHTDLDRAQHAILHIQKRLDDMDI